MAYIDKRAAHYSKGRPNSCREPYPRVDWSRINRHAMKNLPRPNFFPVSGCPQHPEVYPEAPDPNGRIKVCSSPKDCSLPGCTHRTPVNGEPFGSLPGFKTNLGIVAVPTCPVGGYIYTEEGWMLYATLDKAESSWVLVLVLVLVIY